MRIFLKRTALKIISINKDGRVYVTAKELESTTTYLVNEYLTIKPNWPNDWAVLWVLICTMHLTVYHCHACSSNIWPVCINGWMFIYQLSGCGFESCCYHLNFKYNTCFEQGVPWHLGNYNYRFTLKHVREMTITYG